MASMEPHSSTVANAIRKPRVLVVDDNGLSLQVAARLLRDLDCQGALAPDGLTALRLIEEQVFDLVLLDVEMPHFNGQETLLALRARMGMRLRIFMVTGHDDESTSQHYIALGADGMLSKPLTVDGLRHVVQRIDVQATS
ncbi:response regulator [Hylemonella gracilis]|nr:response regulator [Hylemonella gracilis]